MIAHSGVFVDGDVAQGDDFAGGADELAEGDAGEGFLGGGVGGVELFVEGAELGVGGKAQGTVGDALQRGDGGDDVENGDFVGILGE